MNKKLHYFLLSILTLFVIGSISSQITTRTFSYTGGVQSFTVPCGVDTIHIKGWGAGGSGGGSDSYPGAVGGAGAFVESIIPVTPGQVITLIVGGGASPGTNCTGGAPGGSGGWGNGLFNGGNGGNAGSSGCSGGGGGGGGGTAVYEGTTLIFVAGGGGGGSGGGQHSSGATGGGGGQNGSISPGSCNSPGISGGSSNGNGLQGATKGGADGGGGGGGGGGFLGSTGGGVATSCDCGACGGGGGTSWASGLYTNIVNGNGQTPGNSTDPALPAGVAGGGSSSTKGGDGFIAIQYIDGKPEAGFSATTVCYGNTTQFTNNSVTQKGVITTYEWNFGDSSPIDTAFSPSHTYSASGTYTVNLIITNNFTCKDTSTQTITVHATPVASFTTNDVCLTDSVYFTNTSTIDPNGTIAGYGWQFGDGGTSTQQSPAHLYTTGTYSITMIVVSTNLCSDTISQNVSTFDPPTAMFTKNNVCLIEAATFTNTSQQPTMGTIATWEWDFGDGTALNTTTTSPSHLYSSPGDYDVQLITRSSNLACADTLALTITVYPMPIADFDFEDVCKDVATQLTDASIVASGSVTGWNWNFGDGSGTSTSQSPNYTYDYSGTFNITLITTTNNGCKDTISKSTVVHPLPAASFSTTNVCDGFTAQFANSSTISGSSTIQQNGWSFGDGAVATTQNTSHLYSGAGSYTAKLIVVSDFGCKDSVTHTIVVNPNPVVDFTASSTQGCEPLCITLTDASTISNGGNNTSWVWNMGDSSPVPNNAQLQQHCYTNADVWQPVNYSPSLTITSDSGCVTSITKNNFITVYPAPVADFSVNPTTTTTIDAVITIADSSIGATTWDWDFGDFSSSSSNPPLTHEYIDTGVYVITLITTTSYNCSDTTQQTVIIEPTFTIYIPNAFSPNGDGINDTFLIKGEFITEFKMLIYDRWGNVVYKTDDLNEWWDGTANGGNEKAQIDVYVYVIEATDIKSKKHTYRGTVTLLR